MSGSVHQTHGVGCRHEALKMFDLEGDEKGICAPKDEVGDAGAQNSDTNPEQKEVEEVGAKEMGSDPRDREQVAGVEGEPCVVTDDQVREVLRDVLETSDLQACCTRALRSLCIDLESFQHASSQLSLHLWMHYLCNTRSCNSTCQ
jgi:hypothetical protein